MIKKNTFRIILSLCFLLITHQAFSSTPNTSVIYTIHSMQEVEKFVDKDTLVLFDLDHTVFEGKNYSYGHANWFYDQVDKGKAQGIDEKTTIFKIFPHWLHSQKSAAVKPVEPLTPALIKKLQTEGIVTLGLTSRQVPLVDITLNQLASIGIDFNSSFLPSDTISLKFSAPTLMKGGTIFCSEYNDKGTVLRAYLNKIKIVPQKIVFVDDSMRNIKSVIDAYPQITVIGLHYPLVAEYKKNHWDAERAHTEYYEAFLNTAELHNFPLEK